MDGSARPMREVVDSMLIGDAGGCLDYLTRQRETSRPAFLHACRILKGLAEEFWARDPQLFLAHKFRSPDSPLGRAAFQLAVEGIMQGHPVAAREWLASLSLDQLALVGTIYYRLDAAFRQLNGKTMLAHGQKSTSMP